MMKTIYSKYDKTKIGELPRVLFEGRMVVVITESEAQKAVDYLLSQPLLGVDTETRPSFRKGHVNKVALLQVATHDICFLFRLNFVKRRRMTPKSASLKMPPDILLVPSSRLTKTTDTSLILKPRRKAVYFISIWKA